MKNCVYKFLFLLLFCLSCFLVSSSTVWTEDEKVLYEGDSLYHHIRVSEVGGYRYLSFNRTRGNQSVVNIYDHFELKFPYTRASFVVPAFLDRKPERILFVGLGGGLIPRVMAKHYPNAKIDIVEIDQDVIEVAEKYFFFEPTPMMNIVAMDGRRFLRSCNENYDIIFLDAYNDLSIPFHLTTKEFFEIIKPRLTPKGVVASNIWGPRNNQFYLSEIKTFQQVFPNIYLIDAISSSNYIVISFSHNMDMTKTLLEERIQSIQRLFEFNFHLMTYGNTLEDLSNKEINAKVLLDDFAPVEILRSREAAF